MNRNIIRTLVLACAIMFLGSNLAATIVTINIIDKTGKGPWKAYIYNKKTTKAIVSWKTATNNKISFDIKSEKPENCAVTFKTTKDKFPGGVDLTKNTNYTVTISSIGTKINYNLK